MKSFKTFALSGLAGAIIAGTLINPVLAAQPRGAIKKYVQNQTTNSARADADAISTAVEAKPGDILKYTIEVSNDGDSDMYYTNLVDTLPTGVELVGDTSQRQINEDLGVLSGGKSVAKEYLVRVTTAKHGDIIDNKACFTGNSEDKNAAQNGCNNAIVKIAAQQTPPPQAPVAPQPQTPAPPAEKHPAPIVPAPTPPATSSEHLPTTGPTALATTLASLSAGSLGYAGRLFVLQHQQKRRK